MPRQGKNLNRTASGRFKVRWSEIVVVQEADGSTRKTRHERSKTFDSKADADEFRLERRLAVSRGELFEDQRLAPVMAIGTVADAYVASFATAPESTKAFRKSMMNAWRDWVGADTPVSDLSASLLERYAAFLPSEGRAASTRHRKVLEVERMWRWSRKRPDLFPGVPEAASITGDDGTVRAPAPVVRLAAPTWEDVDKMIAQIRNGYLHGDTNRRVATILRFTGLRLSQATGLRWADVRLDHETPYLVVRAGRRGAKSSRGRAIPLHPELVKAFRTWGPADGKLFDIRSTGWLSGELTRDAFKAAWVASGVPVERWSVSADEKDTGERANGSPTHAIRAAVKVGLLRAGVAEGHVDYLIGHASSATGAAYVPESAPETSPIWSRLVEAINTIPPITAPDPESVPKRRSPMPSRKAARQTTGDDA